MYTQRPCLKSRHRLEDLTLNHRHLYTKLLASLRLSEQNIYNHSSTPPPPKRAERYIKDNCIVNHLLSQTVISVSQGNAPGLSSWVYTTFNFVIAGSNGEVLTKSYLEPSRHLSKTGRIIAEHLEPCPASIGTEVMCHTQNDRSEISWLSQDFPVHFSLQSIFN